MLPHTVNADLDRGYDSIKPRESIAESGFTAEIAHRGVPAPIQAGRHRPVERTHSWMDERLRQASSWTSTSTSPLTLVTLRMLIWQVRSHYRWDSRPTNRRLGDPLAGRSQAWMSAEDSVGRSPRNPRHKSHADQPLPVDVTCGCSSRWQGEPGAIGPDS